MNLFKKYRVIPWVLAFLGIVTVSAVTAYIIFNTGILTKEKPAREAQPGTIFQTELSLTPDQNVKVERINSSYKETAEPVISAIRDKKTELLDELSKDQTDTNKVSKIANELYTEQKKLQKANINQFLELKKVCNPEQTKRLSQIYSELYGCSGKGKGQGQGMGHRHRWGQQRKNNQ
ncbi:MAG: periplasmic heavy metal sensor [Bacteroidetes bacterium]|nr:periplasmic heavy metal sensor [Bacteroidota bacterium]